MPENHDRKPQAGQLERPARQPPLFATFSRGRQAITLIVIPIAFGVLAGLTLRWSAPAWWVMQALGVLGAIVAGREHRLLRSAAIRGAIGGLIAAAAVFGGRGLTAGNDLANFDPASFPLVAAIASAGLHAGGAAWRRRRREERTVL